VHGSVNLKTKDTLASKGGRQPLNVLFIEYGAAFGGAVVSMSELVNSLVSRHGVVATVLSPLPAEIMRPLIRDAAVIPFKRPFDYVLRERFLSLLDQLRIPAFLKAPIKKCYAVLDHLAVIVYALRIFRLIKIRKIDLIHINNSMERDALYAARWSGKRCVIHCRGMVDANSRKTIRSRTFAITASKLIAISQAVAASLREQGVPEERLSLIHNPIEWKKYDSAAANRESVRARWRFAPESVVVSIFGRITRWKGQLEFLQSVLAIATDCPDLKVMIVGDASDDVGEYMAEVERLATEGSLRGRVCFVGYQSDVADYYWASDVVVHNSLEAEPFGRVVTEAMACGRAVIAMKEGGPLDIITDNHDGLLVPPRNQGALADAIGGLYRSRQERERLGRSARETVRKRFESDTIALAVTKIYEEVL
jgi:glycosyltransferase involved in cell wall biosynthesis